MHFIWWYELQFRTSSHHRYCVWLIWYMWTQFITKNYFFIIIFIKFNSWYILILKHTILLFDFTYSFWLVTYSDQSAICIMLFYQNCTRAFQHVMNVFCMHQSEPKKSIFPSANSNHKRENNSCSRNEMRTCLLWRVVYVVVHFNTRVIVCSYFAVRGFDYELNERIL